MKKVTVVVLLLTYPCAYGNFHLAPSLPCLNINYYYLLKFKHSAVEISILVSENQH